MTSCKTVNIRISPTLLQFMDKRVAKLRKKFEEDDQTFDRSKYIRHLIRQDMKRSKTQEPQTKDEAYNDVLSMVYLPDRR